MNKKILVATIILAVSQSSWSKINEYREAFSLVEDKCTIVLVDMTSGEITSKEMDAGFVNCAKGKDFSPVCDFLDSSGKKYLTQALIGGVSGSDGGLSAEKGEWEVYINMVTRLFVLKGRAILSDGRFRGTKICSGVLMYESEIEKNKKDLGFKKDNKV